MKSRNPCFCSTLKRREVTGNWKHISISWCSPCDIFDLWPPDSAIFFLFYILCPVPLAKLFAKPFPHFPILSAYLSLTNTQVILTAVLLSMRNVNSELSHWDKQQIIHQLLSLYKDQYMFITEAFWVINSWNEFMFRLNYQTRLYLILGLLKLAIHIFLLVLIKPQT